MTPKGAYRTLFSVWQDLGSPREFVCAGGMPRSLILRQPIRDVDCYWRVHGSRGWLEAQSRLYDLGFQPMDAAYAEYSTDISVYEKGKVQVILTKDDPLTHVGKTFAYGVCKAAITPNNGTVWVHEHFKWEVRHKILRPSASNPPSEKYARKIQSYFPDWETGSKWVVPYLASGWRQYD